MKNRHLKIFAGIFCVLLLQACGTTTKLRFASTTEAYKAADYCKGADIALGEDDVCNATSETLDVTDFNIDELLNGATGLFLSDKAKPSNAFLEQASLTIKEAFASSGVGRAIIEVAVNASVVDYNPMIMDSIYLHSYAFYNALALKDKEEAKLQINRAYNVQQNAVNVFNKEIQAEKKEADEELEKLKKNDGYNEESYNKNNADVMDKYKDFARWKGYKNFVNPYMTYLSGLFFMTNASNTSDYETASTYMDRVVGMMGNNTFVKEDAALADNLAEGKIKNITPTAWVVFENGMVTHFSEFRIDLPIFIATDKVLTASLALPIPKERDAAFTEIQVANGGKKVKTELLTDMDSIFISEFYKKLPVIIGKALAKLTMQTAMQAASQAAAQNSDNPWAGVFSAMTSVYSMITAGADLRSWYTLPKNVQLAKIQKLGKDNLKLHIGNKVIDVKVPKTGHSLVYVRVPFTESTPKITVFDL